MTQHTDSVEAKIVNVPSLPHEPVVTSAEIGSGMWSNNFRQKTAKEIFEDFKKQFQLPDGTFIDHSFPPHEEGEMEKWFIDLYTTLQATQSQQVEEAVREMFNKIKDDINSLEYDTDGDTFKKIVLSRMSSQEWFEALTPNHQD